MKLILHILINTVGIIVATELIPDASVDSIQTAIVLAIVLGALNMFVKPIIKFLTFPITVVTLGLFSVVINVLIVMLAEYFVPGFTLGSVLSALIFSIAMSFITSFLNRLVN